MLHRAAFLYGQPVERFPASAADWIRQVIDL